MRPDIQTPASAEDVERLRRLTRESFGEIVKLRQRVAAAEEELGIKTPPGGGGMTMPRDVPTARGVRWS